MKTKHIQLMYHFIWFILEDRHLKLEKIHTSQNLTNMLTQGEIEFLLSFSWSSKMKMKMRNLPGPRRFRVQHIQQWWSCWDQSPSGRLLVVEPDYLPDSEVFYFQPCLYPMKYLHPKSMYTLPRRGLQWGCTPSVRSGGKRGFGGEALEGKIAL